MNTRADSTYNWPQRIENRGRQSLQRNQHRPRQHETLQRMDVLSRAPPMTNAAGQVRFSSTHVDIGYEDYFTLSPGSVDSTSRELPIPRTASQLQHETGDLENIERRSAPDFNVRNEQQERTQALPAFHNIIHREAPQFEWIEGKLVAIPPSSQRETESDINEQTNALFQNITPPSATNSATREQALYRQIYGSQNYTNRESPASFQDRPIPGLGNNFPNSYEERYHLGALNPDRRSVQGSNPAVSASSVDRRTAPSLAVNGYGQRQQTAGEACSTNSSPESNQQSTPESSASSFARRTRSRFIEIGVIPLENGTGLAHVSDSTFQNHSEPSTHFRNPSTAPLPSQDVYVPPQMRNNRNAPSQDTNAAPGGNGLHLHRPEPRRIELSTARPSRSRTENHETLNNFSQSSIERNGAAGLMAQPQNGQLMSSPCYPALSTFGTPVPNGSTQHRDLRSTSAHPAHLTTRTNGGSDPRTFTPNRDLRPTQAVPATRTNGISSPNTFTPNRELWSNSDHSATRTNGASDHNIPTQNRDLLSTPAHPATRTNGGSDPNVSNQQPSWSGRLPTNGNFRQMPSTSVTPTPQYQNNNHNPYPHRYQPHSAPYGMNGNSWRNGVSPGHTGPTAPTAPSSQRGALETPGNGSTRMGHGAPQPASTSTSVSLEEHLRREAEKNKDYHLFISQQLERRPGMSEGTWTQMQREEWHEEQRQAGAGRKGGKWDKKRQNGFK